MRVGFLINEGSLRAKNIFSVVKVNSLPLKEHFGIHFKKRVLDYRPLRFFQNGKCDVSQIND